MYPRFGLKVGNSELSLAAINSNGQIEIVINQFGDRVTKLNNKNQLLLESGCDQMNLAIEFFRTQYDLVKKYDNLNKNDEKPIVVLSVPKNNVYKDWVNLLTAANEVGFNVKQIIFDTAAAVLAYAFEDESGNNPKNVLSIRISEQWTNITVFQINNGLYSIVYDSQSINIGGKQCTQFLIKFLISKLKDEHNLEQTDELLAKIETIAENAENDINNSANQTILIKSLINNIDFSYELERSHYERLIQSFLDEIAKHLMECKNYLNFLVSPDFEITDVVISGSATKNPFIQNCIKNVFETAILHSELSPEDAIAIGCARQARFWSDSLVGDCYKFSKTFVLSDDMYIYCGEENKSKRKLLFSRGTLLPQTRNIEIERSDVQLKSNTTDEFLINLFLLSDSSSEQTQQLLIETNEDKQIYHLQVTVDHVTNDKSAQRLQCSFKFIDHT